MAFKKAKKVTLADLDAAKAEYEQIYQQVSDFWSELDTECDFSLSSIAEVDELAEKKDDLLHTMSAYTKAEEYAHLTVQKIKNNDDFDLPILPEPFFFSLTASAT